MIEAFNHVVVWVGVRIVILLLAGLAAAADIVMIATLLKPGDERNRMIVYKASAATLLGVALWLTAVVVGCFVRAARLTINPLVVLETIAVVYFAALMVYKRKMGG